MKKHAAFLFLGFLVISFPAEAAETLTLQKAYELALKRSEDIAIHSELIEEAEGHFYQAFSGILPKFHYVLTRFEQEAAQSVSSDSGATSNLLRSKTPQQKFTVTQPLFSGFKEFAGMRGTAAEKAQRKYEKKRAEELLFIDVAEAYYGLQAVRSDLNTYDHVGAVLSDRVRELNDRAKIGRSRESESSTATVDLKFAQADREDAARAEGVWRRLLEFYIGTKIKGELVDEDETLDAVPASEILAHTDQRSDVLAAKEAATFADKKAAAAWGELFPSVKLDGNYYTERVGTQADIDWDVLLTIDVPLFEGTTAVGDIKSASAVKESAKLAWFRARRVAAREAEDAFETFQSSVRRQNLLYEAKAASEENSRMQTEEYRLSLVSNLDVLQALRFHEEAALRWNRARYETKINFWKMKIAAGKTVVSGVEP